MNVISESWYLDRWFNTETQFCQLYPLEIQQLDQKHWTPLHVIFAAIRFLKTNAGDKILDIGSGIGKFCLAAAYYKPNAFFFGIEQRKDLANHAKNAKQTLGFNNVQFIHGNFTQVDFKEFDHFYFFNSFEENLTGALRLDDSIAYSPELYLYYSNYLKNKLDSMPAGTRFVNYCSADDEVPASYRLVKVQGRLKFWIKKREV